MGTQLHQIGPARYVTAGAGNAAAGVLDERSDDEIGSHLRGLLPLHKLPVAVVHHDDGVRTGLLHQLHHPGDLCHCHRRTQSIAPAALDIGHPGSLYRRRNGIKIDVSVRSQLLHLEGHAPFLEAAMAFSPEAYHLFQGIIGASGEGHDGIPGPQHAEQRCGEGMGTGYEIVADRASSQPKMSASTASRASRPMSP